MSSNKKHTKSVNVVTLTVFAIVFAIFAIHLIAKSAIQQAKRTEAMKRCQAVILMDLSTDKPSTSYGQAKKECENIYAISYNYSIGAFSEAVNRDFENHTSEIAGHDRFWYLDQAK